MTKAIFSVPKITCEEVKSYKVDSPERIEAKREYKNMMKKVINLPMIINGKKITSSKKIPVSPPHNHKHIVAYCHYGSKKEVKKAISACMTKKDNWKNTPWEQRCAIFLKAADLLAGPYRQKMNAATMINQSKNIFQAEIDAACELIDFLKFNVKFLTEIYQNQPESSNGIWNRMEYRPLEGFIYAITPFNFTSIAANLCLAPVLMGNTVVWKPSDSQTYSAKIIMDLLKEAGLPDGVINMIHCKPEDANKIIFEHPEFGGVHFTGSTKIFQSIWKEIGKNITKYKSYPRIVGETGGKDFIIAHKSADIDEITTAIIRGGFEYQGQKCSAASRIYLPKSQWKKIEKKLISEMQTIKVGSPEDFSNFVNAVIHNQSFDKLKSTIQKAKKDKNAKIIFGGRCDKSIGYFIEPTIILTTDPNYDTMKRELFGPIVTIYLYKDEDFEKTLNIINKTSEYALTGSIFSKDRDIIIQASKVLENSAGNFYINDKPTGAVVSQQPFGGSRGSGTNDKAGSYLNLLRWVSPRTIKETFVPPKNYRYPFLKETN